MKTLVTGGDGFVGRHLLERLIAEGAEIVATTVSRDPAPTLPAGVKGPSVAWQTADILDRAGLDRLLKDVGPSRIFHAAGFSSGAAAGRRPLDALRVNAEGTLHLLEAAATAGVEGTIVVPGSADVYGPGPSSGDRLSEQAPVRPVSAYGASKAAQEAVALGVGAARGLDVRVARLFPQIGPGQGADFVLPSFCRRALQIAEGRDALRIRVGNLDVERDFTDVRDGVRALALLGGLQTPRHRVYNVCSGGATTVRSLLDWVLDVAGVEAEIEVDQALVRATDAKRVIGDAGRLRDETGWTVERDLQTTVHDTFQALRDRTPAC